MSTDSIRLRRDRLGRNALYSHCQILESGSIDEPLVADGFESYTRSKYYPNNLNLLVGRNSEFLYGFTMSYFRRNGRMTKRQQDRVKWEYQDKSFDSSKLTKQFLDLLTFAADHVKTTTVSLHTDKHKIYQSVVNHFNRTSKSVAITHHQTSSKETRTIDNPLFAANYLDRLLRKDSAMYRRDTVCFSRSTHNELLRNAFFLFSHNYCKPKRITTHAKQTQERHYSMVPIDGELVRAYKQVMYTRRFLLSKAKNIPSFFKAV